MNILHYVGTVIMLVVGAGTVDAQQEGILPGNSDRPLNGLLEMTVVDDIATGTASGARAQGSVLVIRIKNIARVPIEIAQTYPELDFPLEVRDENGQVVPLTEGAKVLPAFSGGVHVGSIRSIKLYPDERYEARIDVSRFYDVKPGRVYTVRIKTSIGPRVDALGKTVDRELRRSVRMTIPISER